MPKVTCYYPHLERETNLVWIVLMVFHYLSSNTTLLTITHYIYFIIREQVSSHFYYTLFLEILVDSYYTHSISVHLFFASLFANTHNF